MSEITWDLFNSSHKQEFIVYQEFAMFLSVRVEGYSLKCFLSVKTKHVLRMIRGFPTSLIVLSYVKEGIRRKLSCTLC